MDNKPTYEELMVLYLKEKEKKEKVVAELKDAQIEKEKVVAELKDAQIEKEKVEVELKDALETINELSKLLEYKNIKLAKQLCERFGIKSDKKEVVVGNEAEVHATIKLEKKDKKKTGRKPGTKDAYKFDESIIETKEIILDIENHKCEACGNELTYTGDNIQYKVEIIPAKVILKKYIIKQYKCENCIELFEEEQINCFNNESFLTPSLGAYIVNNKYNYALPLYRIETILKQLGAPLTRQQLSNYCINVAEKLEPIYERLKYHLLNSSVKVLHADETTLKVLEKKERSKCYMWLYATSMYDNPIYIYEYQDSREAKHPSLFLKDYKGYLVCDDYSGYESISDVSLCRCWFHAKKKYADFIKTLTNKQKETSEAVIIHNKISNIFFKENLIQEEKLTASLIKEKREKEIKPLVDEYFEYIENLYNNDVDKSSVLGKAIKYSINIKDDLYRFLLDGHIPLTNNLSERAIKPFVILRKNCLFCNTQNGAEASAILMSIVQTAKMNLIKPDEYIKYVLENIDDIKISDLDTLLPFNKDLPTSLKYDKKDLD